MIFGWRKRIEAKLDQLISMGEKEMASIADVEALITTMQGELTTLGTDVDAIIAKLQASGTVPAADLASLQAISDGIKAASAKLEAANPTP